MITALPFTGELEAKKSRKSRKRTSDRGWWSRLHLMGREKRVRFIVRACPSADRACLLADRACLLADRAYRMGVIDDHALWDVLSHYNGPVSYRDAVAIYRRLGFVPHAGYPLTVRETPERSVFSEGGGQGL